MTHFVKPKLNNRSNYLRNFHTQSAKIKQLEYRVLLKNNLLIYRVLNCKKYEETYVKKPRSAVKHKIEPDYKEKKHIRNLEGYKVTTMPPSHQKVTC